MSKKFNMLITALSVLLLVGIDQGTKWIANTNETLLAGGTLKFIPHIIGFKLAYNTGAAWSILEGQRFVLTLISLIASVAVGAVAYKCVDFKKKKVLSIALVLILGGTIGNLIDRAFYPKGVIDFLNFEFMSFPIFNFADSCLTIGMIMCIIYVLFIYKEPAKAVASNSNVEIKAEDEVEEVEDNEETKEISSEEVKNEEN